MEICGLRAVEENAKIAHSGVEFVSKIAAETCRMLFGIRTTGRGSESSEMWSPPVAVGFGLNRRRRIIWGRLVWPSGAVSAATKAASWSLVVF
ncbi:hypothetical protein DY000_02049019 [Brassica cretica]|uniref:Uncharacterized protein n=1 Tax=Brassica cretica TaxID=69181 RepID=A0ABQ7ERC4_BRACR|nr:hypothetical protein DY000_02049019 [Brassica cretica]